MASAIGQLSIKIIADATGVTSGVNAAKSAIGGLADYVGGVLGGDILGALTKALSLVDSVAGTLRDKWNEISPAISKSAKDARRLGMSVEDMMGLQGAFASGGLDPDEAINKLFMMRSKFSGDFMAKMKSTADEVARLGPAGEAAGEKAKMMHEMISIGNRHAAKMVTLFEKGGDALQEQINYYKEIYSVTDAQAAAVERARGAWHKVNFVIKGFWNQVVVHMAPAVEKIGQMWLEMGPAIRLAGELVGRMVGDTMLVAGSFLEVVLKDMLRMDDLLSGWNKDDKAGWVSDMQDRFREFLLGVMRGIGKIADFMVTLQEEATKWGEAILAVMGDMKQAFEDMKPSSWWFQQRKLGEWGRPHEGAEQGPFNKLIAFFDPGRWADAAKSPLKGLADEIAEKAGPFKAAAALETIIADAADAALEAKHRPLWENIMVENAREWLQFATRGGKARGGEEGGFVPYSAVAALTEGSKEAYSFIAKFQHDALFGKQDIDRQQLRMQEQIRDILRGMAAGATVKELKVDLGDKFDFEVM